jgi:hypothetical protein
MKITLFSTVALIALITIFSCKKSNSSSTTPTVTSSQWMYNNVTYKGDTTFFIDDGTGYTLESYVDDTASHVAGIEFGTKPLKSGSFAVVDGNTNPTATQCSVYFGTLSDEYGSITGGTATITIANGKITGVFSNITCSDGTTSIKISGTLIASDN